VGKPTTFAELFRSYIGDRTLSEMVDLCAARGVRLHLTYISKLRTGASPAPDDPNVVRVLAEACGKDPEPLLIAAMVERRPHEALNLVLRNQLELSVAAGEFERHQTEMLQAIGAVAEEKGFSEEIDACMRPHNAEIMRLIGVRLELLKKSMLSPYIMAALPEDLRASLAGTITPEKIQRSEDSLVRELAEVAKLPVSALATMVTALKQVVNEERGATPGALFADMWGGRSYPRKWTVM